MFCVQIFTILVFIQFSNSNSTPAKLETNNFEDILMEEERNARCCAQHMDCCRNSSEATSFEVRALLVKCAKTEVCCEKSAACPQRRVPPKNEEECDNATPRSIVPQDLSACDKKLKLTIKIKNIGITNTKNQYIIIDHVFDPLTEKKQKLMYPYVLKIKQEQILQIYGLNFDTMVNSEAKERVVNKNDEGYTGCSTDANQNPTCGSMRYEDEVIPYSTGFCCPCHNNQIEQTAENLNFTGSDNSNISPKKTREVYNIDVPGYNKRNYDHYGFTDKGGTVKEDSVAVNRGPFRNMDHQRLIHFKERHVQKRGGQDCSDRSTPPNANPQTYHDSAHCLEFSDLWYTVYSFQEPKLYHSLHFQLYEKCQDQIGDFKWIDLTNNAPVTIGSNNKFHLNEDNSLTATYMARDVSPNMFSINYKIKKLLIPDASKVESNDSYQELKGGAEEYLVENENQIQVSGKSCNTAGVGYEAFVKQPNRCSKPRGTCLKNQPKHLWTHDHEAEAAGKKGLYFLKYHGVLTENPIESLEGCQNKTLKMFYIQPYTSILDLELKADANVVLRPNSLAIITEVYVDSSSPKKTSIIVKIFNSGLVSSLFFVSLTRCPLDLPATFNNIVSKPALIAPQQQHTFNLKIECPLPINSFFCAIEVLNVKEELIAFRKIRLEKLDRCICIWHCLCACLISDKALKCKPLSLEHYHAAGFQGGLPVPLHVVHYTFWDDLISLILYILIFLCLTLLIMGLTKAIAGCFMIAIGLWGLDIILELPKKMNKYYEIDIKHREVIYDDNGWPIHPDTNERVRNISLPAEFSVNVVFFFVYPFALAWSIIKKLCFSSYHREYEDYDMCVCKGNMIVKRSSSLQLSINNKKPLSGNNREEQRNTPSDQPLPKQTSASVEQKKFNESKKPVQKEDEEENQVNPDTQKPEEENTDEDYDTLLFLN